MRVREALRSTADRLTTAGCESPRADAEILLAHVLGVSRSTLRADLDRELAPADATRIEGLVARRERREPLAYVLGEWGFRRLTLAVDPRVLIPRPETEVVVDRALALIVGVERPRVLDVGTGSGAIALSIADECRGALVTALDRSPDALAVAHENVDRAGLEVELVEWDLHEGLPTGPWNLVVANPPYVRPDEMGSLEPEVRDWEPREALVGDGATEAISAAAFECLVEGGALVLEVAGGDAARVAEVLRGLGYRQVSVTQDLTGRERVVEGVKP